MSRKQLSYSMRQRRKQVFIHATALIRKMNLLVLASPEFRLESQDEVSKTYICPKRLISIRKSLKLSDEQKKERAARLRR